MKKQSLPKSFLLLFVLSVASLGWSAPETSLQVKEPGVQITVRGYEPFDINQEITRQEQLFRHIVVELELTIDESKPQVGKPIVQVMPIRSGLDRDPRF